MKFTLVVSSPSVTESPWKVSQDLALCSTFTPDFPLSFASDFCCIKVTPADLITLTGVNRFYPMSLVCPCFNSGDVVWPMLIGQRVFIWGLHVPPNRIPRALPHRYMTVTSMVLASLPCYHCFLLKCWTICADQNVPLLVARFIDLC